MLFADMKEDDGRTKWMHRNQIKSAQVENSWMAYKSGTNKLAKGATEQSALVALAKKLNIKTWL